jgi:hypothetical protein
MKLLRLGISHASSRRSSDRYLGKLDNGIDQDVLGSSSGRQSESSVSCRRAHEPLGLDPPYAYQKVSRDHNLLLLLSAQTIHNFLHFQSYLELAAVSRCESRVEAVPILTRRWARAVDGLNVPWSPVQHSVTKLASEVTQGR